jgi:hypothetical protein
MPIETDCPGCSRRLRVADDAAGGKARCPVCNTIYSVPGDDHGSAPPPGPAPDAARWKMRTPEGRSYGPVTRQELDRWVSEGRVTADCLIQDGESQSWRNAEVLYPVLQTVVAEAPEVRTSPAGTPANQPRGPRVEPHRGAIILTLGIMSWMSCPLFGVFAWSMGTADLHRMQVGRMDREGRALTQAGQILGMVHVVLSIVFITLFVFFMLLMAVAS